MSDFTTLLIVKLLSFCIFYWKLIPVELADTCFFLIKSLSRLTKRFKTSLNSLEKQRIFLNCKLTESSIIFFRRAAYILYNSTVDENHQAQILYRVWLSMQIFIKADREMTNIEKLSTSNSLGTWTAMALWHSIIIGHLRQLDTWSVATFITWGYYKFRRTLQHVKVVSF